MVKSLKIIRRGSIPRVVQKLECFEAGASRFKLSEAAVEGAHYLKTRGYLLFEPHLVAISVTLGARGSQNYPVDDFQWDGGVADRRVGLEINLKMTTSAMKKSTFET